MQNLNSSNAKSRKLFYYLQYIPQVLFLPSIISRLSLKKILKNNNSKHKYIESRVKYYLKKLETLKFQRTVKTHLNYCGIRFQKTNKIHILLIFIYC